MDFPGRDAARLKRLQEQADHELALRLAGYGPDATQGVEVKGDKELAMELYEDEFRDLIESTKSMRISSGPEADRSVCRKSSGKRRVQVSGEADETTVLDEEQPGDADARFYDKADETTVLNEEQPGDADARFYDNSHPHDVLAESSSNAASRGKSRQVQPGPRNCVACHDQPGTAAVPCGHCYCPACLTEVFRTAMGGGTAFPPRCCQQPMQLEDARTHLGPRFALEFEQKAVELATSNPVYCHRLECSTFIPPEAIQGADNAQCPSCQQRTCTHCKAQAHGGECQQDEALQQVLEMATGEGWRRCECGRVIELDTGCNHMTCQCRREFCYVCGLRWKTCACPQWEEHRLLRRAEQIVDRGPRHGLVPVVQQPVARAAAPPQPQARTFVPRVALVAARADLPQRLENREARIQVAAQQLRQNANCVHPLRWRGVGPNALCEFCHKHKARIHACKHCGLIACYPCRRNRF